MNIYSVSFILLLFELCTVIGFSIPKIQQRSSQVTEVDKNKQITDVYEVREGERESLRIISPKAEKPTLREIIYYHVIETPYDDSKVSNEDKGPDFDDTRRPFTNSHGLPFIPDDIKKDVINKDKKQLRTEDSTADTDTDASVSLVAEESGEEITEEFEEESDTSTEEPVEELTTAKEDTAESNKTEVLTTPTTTTAKELVESVVETTTVSPITTIQDKVVTTERRDDVVEEKKNARNLLFSQTKNKYENIVRKPVKAPAKRKREIRLEDIPEAPTLPKLNYEALPEYVRKLISTPKPETPTHFNERDEREDFSEEDFKEELEHKIDEIIASAMPDIEGDGEEEDLEIEKENEVKRVPRTYGMNLTMDRGYVWNDLWSKPGMSFDIGDLETIEEDKKEIITDIPDHEIKPIEHILHPAESRPITEENNVIENSNNMSHNQENNIHDLEDIEIPKIPKSILIDEDKDSDELEQEENYDNESKIQDNRKIEENKDSNEREIQRFRKTEKNPKENLVQDNKTEKPLESEKPNKNTPEEKMNEEEKKSDNKNEDMNEEIQKKVILPAEKVDILQDLMKNEEFWKWLGDWTSTYLELMMKHIKRFVHDEVSRQMKSYAMTKDTPVEGKKQPIDEKPKESIEHKETEKKTHEKDNKERENNVSKQKEPNKKGNEQNITKHNELDEKELIITDNKIIVDGKEIPITQNSNFNKEDVRESKNDLLKRRKDKDDNKITTPAPNKKPTEKMPIQISANNIFGNSAGNDKVTNIFIFYPSEDEDSYIIDDLKPLINGSGNIFAFGNGEIDKIKEPELTGHKDETTMTEHTTTTIKPIEGLKEPEDKINSSKDEGKDDNNNDNEHSKDRDTNLANIESNIHNNKEVGEDNVEIESNNEKPIENNNKDEAEKPKVEGTDDKKDSSSTEANKENPIDHKEEKVETEKHDSENKKADDSDIVSTEVEISSEASQKEIEEDKSSKVDKNTTEVENVTEDSDNEE